LGRLIVSEEEFYYRRIFTEKEQTMSSSTKGRYGFLNFCFDVFMTLITCSFWLIWVFVRELRGLR
jgi:hypothetical protein